MPTPGSQGHTKLEASKHTLCCAANQSPCHQQMAAHQMQRCTPICAFLKPLTPNTHIFQLSTSTHTQMPPQCANASTHDDNRATTKQSCYITAASETEPRHTVPVLLKAKKNMHPSCYTQTPVSPEDSANQLYNNQGKAHALAASNALDVWTS